jgi:flagellar protein FliO/FliZ
MIRALMLPVALATPVWAEETQAPAAVNLPIAGGEDVIGLLGSLMLMAALLIAGMWFLRRLRAAQAPKLSGIAVVSQIPLGVKEKLLVVQVGDQSLLVGCTPSSMQTLHSWPTAELPEAEKSKDFAALLKEKAGHLREGFSHAP